MEDKYCLNSNRTRIYILTTPDSSIQKDKWSPEICNDLTEYDMKTFQELRTCKIKLDNDFKNVTLAISDDDLYLAISNKTVYYACLID